MDFKIILMVIATTVIICLAFYAGMLINKIKSHKIKMTELADQQARQALLKKEQRNNNICESIRFIARATAQKQCNVSEASIRLSVLLETLLIEPKIAIDKNYPALSTLFAHIKDFATHNERKNMNKKVLKQQDKQRQIFEAQFEDAIIKEAQQLATFSL